MDGVTFAALLTAAGAGIAATIVTLTVDLIKTAFTRFGGQDWDGMVMAFGISAVLYVLAAVATNAINGGLDALLGVFLAWLTCATAAVGIHKAVVKPIAETVTKA